MTSSKWRLEMTNVHNSIVLKHQKMIQNQFKKSFENNGNFKCTSWCLTIVSLKHFISTVGWKTMTFILKQRVSFKNTHQGAFQTERRNWPSLKSAGTPGFAKAIALSPCKKVLKRRQSRVVKTAIWSKKQSSFKICAVVT